MTVKIDMRVEVMTPKSGESGPSISVEEEHLKPYEDKGHTPKYLKYYRPFSYGMFTVTIITSLAYFMYVGTIFFNPIIFHIQFEPVVKLYEYNSYNLQCPMLGILFAVVFMYHVKYRVKLEEGDFFGLVGLLLLFAMVMCYDAVGVYHVYAERLEYMGDKEKQLEKYNEFEDNVLAWQYAWSTYPSCAKIYAKKRREEAERESHRGFTDTGGPKILSNMREGDTSYWFYSGKTKDQLLQGLSGRVHNVAQRQRHAPLEVPLEEETPEDEAFRTKCGNTAESIEPVAPKSWMTLVNQVFECCGPQGYDHWATKVNDMSSCESKGKKFTRSCAVPFSQYILKESYVLMVFMYIMAFLFMIANVTACLHFAAMKYENVSNMKKYSLLDLTEPDGVKVIDLNRITTRRSKVIMGDPTKVLLQANARAQSSRRSAGQIPRDPRYAFTHSAHSAPYAGRRVSMHQNAMKNLTTPVVVVNKSKESAGK